MMERWITVAGTKTMHMVNVMHENTAANTQTQARARTHMHKHTLVTFIRQPILKLHAELTEQATCKKNKSHKHTIITF